MTLSNRLYDFFKRLVQIIIPAAATLYAGLAVLYEWTNADVVLGTLALAATFIGSVLGISSHNYSGPTVDISGDLVTVPDENSDQPMLMLQLLEDPKTMSERETVTFKVANVIPKE